METELKKAVENVLEELAEFGRKLEKFYEDEIDEDPIWEFLENVLDVSRTQAFVNGRWKTTRYTFCVAWGGPAIYVSTDGVVEGYWGAESITVPVTDPDAKEFLRELEEYLDEVYGKG